MVYDAIIIGARVAGSALATMLGQQGHGILLIDKATFPSDTLSTHFFRRPTFNVLERIGIFDQVLPIAPKLVNGFTDFEGKVSNNPFGDDGREEYCLCVRRVILDEFLTRRVLRQPGVELRQGATLDELIWDGAQVVGVRWHAAGQAFEAKGRVVVGADGFYSQVAKQVKPVVERSEPVNRAMYYAYYQGLQSQPGPAAEFHLRGDQLVYVFPTDSNLTLIAVSIPIAEFDPFRKAPEPNLMAKLEDLPELTPRLRRAERVGPVRGAANIPGYLRVPYGAGWALVGDAGMVQDPWSGQGIDQASTHAAFLADSLHAWLIDEMSWEQAMQQYHTNRNQYSLSTFENTCQLSRDLRLLNNA
jgi:flavin-dependent dehydrogenase